MNSTLSFPKTVVFVALGKESLPLVKRAMLPLIAATNSGIAWVDPSLQRAQISSNVKRISDADYLQHLQQEYQRLPENLQGLFSVDEFIRQAEPKRSDIEAALLAKRVNMQQVELGNANDWLLQRFWKNPYSTQAWSIAGWDKLWLGFDLSQWPDSPLQEVLYQQSLPAQLPERLLVDATDMQGLSEQRWLVQHNQVSQWVNIAGQRQGLVRFPSKAVHSVLFGAAMNPAFIQKFTHYWRQDLRYKQKPLIQMALHPHKTSWSFTEL